MIRSESEREGKKREESRVIPFYLVEQPDLGGIHWWRRDAAVCKVTVGPYVGAAALVEPAVEAWS